MDNDDLHVKNNNSWNSKKEHTLIKWKESFIAQAWLHNKSRIYYEAQFNWLNVPIIIINMVAAIFTTIGAAVEGSVDKCEDNTTKINMTILIILGILNSFSVSLGVSLSGKEPSKKAAEHDVSYKLYQTIINEIDLNLAQSRCDRNNGKIVIEEFLTKANDLFNSAPRIPQSIWKSFSKDVDSKQIYKEAEPGIVFRKTSIEIVVDKPNGEKVENKLNRIKSNIDELSDSDNGNSSPGYIDDSDTITSKNSTTNNKVLEQLEKMGINLGVSNSTTNKQMEYELQRAKKS